MWKAAELMRTLRIVGAMGALVAVVCGCASPGIQAQRVLRYRPDVDDRRPWTWDPSLQGHAGRGPEQAGEVAGKGEDAAQGKILKRGDHLVIYLRGIPEPEEVKNVVDETGTLNLPLVGTIPVDGKKVAEAERLVEKAYVDGGYYQKINVIIVAEEDEYYVRGEVKREGRYPLSRDMTLLQAIATAGGYTDYAKSTQIQLIRGDQVTTYNAKRIEQRKDKDPFIEPGDIIIVSRRVFL
jgi:polysaccharide export outer membrane protein